MLILTRAIHESIVIGDGITLTIVSVRDGDVKIAVKKPQDTAVHLLENYEIIKNKNAKTGNL